MHNRKLVAAAVIAAATLGVGLPAWAYIDVTSASFSATTTAAATMTAATNVSVTSIGGTATLTWTAPTTPSANFTYTVARSGGTGTEAGTCAAGVSTTTCQDTAATAGQSYTWTVTAHLGAWNSPTTGASVTATAAGVINKFLVQAPSTATAGTAFTTTVTARDSLNDTVTGYSGTIAFTSSDSQAVLPSNYTFAAADNGVHAFTTTALKTAGSQTISVKDTVATTATGTSAGITVSAAAASTMAIVQGSSQTTWVSTAFGTALEVQVKDQYGNPVSGVSVTFTAPGSGASGTFANGTATTSATTDSAGDATASAFTANSTAGNISVTTSATGVSAPPSFSLTSVGSLSISTVVRDAGNKKVHFTGTNAISGNAITVYICNGPVASCPSGSAVATSAAATPSSGNWTSAQDSSNLSGSANYTAQAVSGSATSAVFNFSTTNL